jgi:uncharacterized protein (TIGR03000 family)
MYSVVMMMAMTAAPEAPNCGWMHGCKSYGACYGCGGGCYGGGYGGYYSTGCYGGGYAYSCGGCWGGYAPYAGCVGYGIYGGASYTWPTYYSGYGGCGGCYGYGYPAPAVMPGSGIVTPPVIEDKKIIEPKKTSLPAAPDQARVIIRLPADATLYANNVPTALTSAERAFVTPSLEKGRDFQYTMKVEYVRDGRTVTDSKVVRVRAGDTAVAEFADVAAAATVTSTIKVVLPAGAKLYVDNLPRELASGSAEFRTPALVKGSEYAYSFRAERVVGGKKLEKSQRVVFKAGEPVMVDFTELADATLTASK